MREHSPLRSMPVRVRAEWHSAYRRSSLWPCVLGVGRLFWLRRRRSPGRSAIPAAAPGARAFTPGPLLLFGPRSTRTNKHAVIDDRILQLQRLEERLEIRAVLPDFGREVADLGDAVAHRLERERFGSDVWNLVPAQRR